jgi:TRAP-type uncharacterized transport system fused permease subunit
MITPPVAIAAYAAANIARVPGWATSLTAVAVGWSTFFIPFLFVLEPALLMEGPWYWILWQFARNLLGIFVGTSAIVGYAFSPLSAPMRVCFAVAALAVLTPPNLFAGAGALDWAGLAACAGVLAYSFTQRSRRRVMRSAQAVKPR